MKESDSTRKHKSSASKKIVFQIIVVSTGVSKGEREDRSGPLIRKIIEEAGYEVSGINIIPDDSKAIASSVRTAEEIADAIILTGGTGLTSTDITIEAIRPLLRKEISAFQTLFTTYSNNEVGPSCMLSRAMAGLINRSIIFAIPGSPQACELALKQIIIPEVAHISKHAKE